MHWLKAGLTTKHSVDVLWNLQVGSTLLLTGFLYISQTCPPPPLSHRQLSASWIKRRHALTVDISYHHVTYRMTYCRSLYHQKIIKLNNLANAAQPLVRVHPWPHYAPWPSKIILFVDLKGREQICTFCIFNSVIFMIFCGHIRGN